ncbi:hypothetical protein BH18ACT6_BH18ACT6_22220 [soil metagenome]
MAKVVSHLQKPRTKRHEQTLYAESGNILVTLPEGISYSIVANAPEIIVLGEARSGTVITELQAPGQPTLRIDATSIEGTITIEEGSRS